MQRKAVILRVAIGLICISGVVVFIAYLFTSEIFEMPGDVNFADLPQPGPMLATWASIGAIGIWLWMLTDFFSAGPKTYRVLWGWSLFIGSYVAAIIYFAIIYVPRLRAKNE